MAGRESSSASSPFTYEVFLNFRGEDTRYEFTGNLYFALKYRGIHTFFDDQELRKGNAITPSLVKAIEASRIAITVLSKSYASSSFCLDELAKIMECIKGKDQLVIPIFYDLDPSDVRKQTGIYGEALAVHENKFMANTENFNDNMERLHRWRMALKQVADLSGYHFKRGDGDYEFKFIAKIVEHVSTEIRRVALPVIDHPVGLDYRLKKVTWLLKVGSNDGVRVLGIYGMGGIGKTTLALAVFNWIADRSADLSFESSCFLENVRENSNKHGLQHLQKILLSELAGEKKVKVTSVKKGMAMLEQRLQQKKIFLVLDDVDQEEQLEALARKFDWFGFGSRVIITTRDKNLLSRYKGKIMYELEKLNKKDALELLSWKALKTNEVDPSYRDVLNDVVTYASGLPLALEVIGSNLMGRSIEEWKSILDQYRRIPNKKIQTILKISFDALEEFVKEIFLDIACCFGGYGLTYVKEVLCAHHGVISVDYDIGVLVEKSLIKIHGLVTLHDQIQDMGREIIRQESPKRPAKRSRLWLLEDIVPLFEKNMGTDKVEMIYMNDFKYEKVITWDGEAFKKMRNLKTLIIYNIRFSQGVKYLPNSLKVLRWLGYPSHSLPLDFCPEGLVVLELSGTCLMSVGFLHKQKFKSLTVIILDRSYIEEIPDVSNVPNLKELSFCWCGNLIKVHESVGFMSKLKILNVVGCRKLRSFPPIRLPSLRMLILAWCSSLENFPKILGEMEKIEKVDGSHSSIRELPSSIKNLTTLRHLILQYCGMLLFISSSIVKLPYLETVDIRQSKGLHFLKQHESEDQESSTVSSNAKDVAFPYCNMSNESIPIVLTWFRNVEKLDLSGNNFTIFPKSIEELYSLRSLTLNDCKKLQKIEGIPPNIKCFFARNCISLTSTSTSMLLDEKLHEDGDKKFLLPGSSIPEWFYHSNRKDSISFWFRNSLPAISLCVVAGTGQFDWSGAFSYKLIINGNKISSDSPSWDVKAFIPYHITIFDPEYVTGKDVLDKVRSEKKWNHVEFQFEHWSLEKGYIIKQIGMRLLKHKSSMEDISFTTPTCMRGSDDDLWTVGRELSLRPCWQEHLDFKILRSNLMQSASISCTVRNEDQGCETASTKRKRSTSMLDLNNEPSVIESFYHPPSEVDLHSDSSLASNTTTERVLDHLENTTVESSQALGFAERQNIRAPFPTSSSGIVTGEESHKKTCCTVLPTTTDESFKNQIDISQDDDVEMEEFYASLDGETHVLSPSQDHFPTNAPNEEAREALKIVQDFITNNDASVFLDREQCNTMKSSLDYLSNLSSNDGLSGEMRALISEASGVFTHCSSDYIEATMKIESSASEMQTADKLKATLKDNKNRFGEVMALEKELLQKLAEESKELVLNMTRKRKRDIFEEGKALKSETDKLKGKVSHLQHEQDLAKETQAKVKAKWSELGEKFRKIVVE